MIAQCSITVALAWLLARQLLGHVQSIVRFEGVDALIASPRFSSVRVVRRERCCGSELARRGPPVAGGKLVHVSALLRKFGISGRGDLSAVVRASELTAPPHR
jgi:hypothetical protein